MSRWRSLAEFLVVHQAGIMVGLAQDGNVRPSATHVFPAAIF